MFFPTHMLLPVLGAMAYDALGRCGDRAFQTRHLWAIALCGVLPDLADPHLYLDARLHSWSHTLWFAAGTAVLAVAARGSGIIARTDLAVGMVAAVLLHLAADAISGGIAPLGPRGPALGSPLVASVHWLWIDLALVIALLVVIAARRARQLQAGSREQRR